VKRHSIETKAKVLAHLKTGVSVREAAAAAGVPVSTAGDIAAKGTGQIRTEKAELLGDRLLELVEEIVAANIATAKLLADPAYLRQHKPDEVAVLAGALLDRAFKILEAMERTERAQGGSADTSQPRASVTLYQLPANGRERS
jgi:hypothetical protein